MQVKTNKKQIIAIAIAIAAIAKAIAHFQGHTLTVNIIYINNDPTFEPPDNLVEFI